jgi:stage V sporulation protein SpoVS
MILRRGARKVVRIAGTAPPVDTSTNREREPWKPLVPCPPSASARELPDTKLLPVARGTDVHKLALKVAHEVQGEFVSEIPDCCLRAVGPQAVEIAVDAAVRAGGLAELADLRIELEVATDRTDDSKLPRIWLLVFRGAQVQLGDPDTMWVHKTTKAHLLAKAIRYRPKVHLQAVGRDAINRLVHGLALAGGPGHERRSVVQSVLADKMQDVQMHEKAVRVSTWRTKQPA